MERKRMWMGGAAVIALAGMGVLAATGLAQADGGPSSPSPVSDQEKSQPGVPESVPPHAAMTLDEVKAKFNPENLPSIVVSRNPDGTFRVEQRTLVGPGAVVLPPPLGGYDDPNAPQK